MNGDIETLNKKKKKQEGGLFSAMMSISLIAPVASPLIQSVALSLENVISWKGFVRAGKGEEGRFLSLLALPLMMKVLGSKVMRVGIVCNKRNKAGYFDSLGIEYILPEVLNRIKDKSITHDIFRIRSDDSIICKFYCIALIAVVILYLYISS